MKGTKLLLSLWLATAAFCLVQILIGPGGLTETARLQAQQTRLENRLQALRAENARLTARYEALRSGTAEIRLEARALGYFQRGETPVRTLDGVAFRLPSEEPDLSTVARLPDTSGTLAVFFRVAWLLLFLIFYTMFYLMERFRPRDDHFAEVRRSPSRNLPVPVETGLDFFRK